MNFEVLKNVKEMFKVMYLFLRVDEIYFEVDKMKYVFYFRQVFLGVFVRMVLFGLMFGVLGV